MIGGAKQKSHAMKSSEIFERGIFAGQRYRKMEDQKPWPGLALNREFSKRRRLKSKVTNENLFIQTYHRRGFGDVAPSRWAIFWNFVEKKAILMPLDHISHVFRTI